MTSPSMLFDRATLRAEQLAARAGSVDWRALLLPWARRAPLLLLMAVPFLLGFTLRLAVRVLARFVWTLGWLAAWLWYTAVEGWTAAAGREGT